LGEDYAEDFIKTQGYKILERNYRSKSWGEIDIIAMDGDTLVFIEVKTRLSQEFGYPEEQVRFYKFRSLKRSANYYKLKHPDSPESLRLDMVAVQLDPATNKPHKIRLFKNITE